MSDYYLDTSRAEVVKAFAKQLWAEWRQNGAIWNNNYGLCGKGPEYAVNEINTLMKTAGDEVTFPYLFQLPDDPGVMGSEVLEGKEDAPDYGYFKVKINKQRHGTQVYGEMFQQMVHFDVAKAAKSVNKDWFLKRREVAAINHLGGYVPQTDLRYTGLNAVTAVASDHVYRPNSLTTDQAVAADNTAKLDLDVLSEVRAIVDNLTPPIEPLTIGDWEGYVLLIHPNQKADLDLTTSDSFDVSKAALQGGFGSNHPFFNRVAGSWQDILFVINPFVTTGYHSTNLVSQANCRRAVLLGRNALGVAYGRHVSNTKDPFKMYLGARDHEDKLITSCSLIWGCKAVTFTKNDGSVKDGGRFVITTYSADRISGQGNHGQSV